MLNADPAQSHVAKTLAHTSPLISCRFDPTGRFVFAGAEDNRVWRWEIESGAKVELTGHDSWVRSLGFSTNGEVIVTGGYDGRLVWWPALVDKPAPARTVEAHQGWIRALSVSPDGQWVATCGNDRHVKIWQMSDGMLVRDLTGHESHVYNVAFHPNGKELVSGDLKSQYIHWDATTGEVKRKFAIPALHKYDAGFLADIGGAHSMAFGRDGKLLACGGITNVTNAFAGVGNPAIVLWDWEANKEVVMHLTKGNINGVAWGTIVHPDGFTIGATGGGGGGHLFFWKFDQKNEFHTLNLGNTARDLAMHPDGVRLATAHFDKQLRVIKMGPKG
ncbi:MAG: WD40 repeat domain-containing protein [Pirellulales bacterium]